MYSDIDSFIRTKRLPPDKGGRITIYHKEYLPESGTSLFSFSSRSCTQPTTTVEKKQSFWHILQVRTCIIRVPRLKVIMEKKSYLYKNVAYRYTMDDDAHSFWLMNQSLFAGYHVILNVRTANFTTTSASWLLCRCRITMSESLMLWHWQNFSEKLSVNWMILSMK